MGVAPRKSFFLFLVYFNWRAITFQLCGGPRHTSTWISHRCTYTSPILNLPLPPPSHPISLCCPRATALRPLLHSLNLHWLSVLHMVIYMFQCYFFKSSHPCLLPQSPIVCSLHLCLFCCLASRIVINILSYF